MSSKFNLKDRIKTVKKLPKHKCKSPNLKIKLHRDHFLGVFVNQDTLTRITTQFAIIQDEVVRESQCVPFSLYLLARAIESTTTLYEDTSLETLTGLGETHFSKNASRVIESIFPSVDVEGKRCETLFRFREIYHSSISHTLENLGDVIVSSIIRPFIDRYPCKDLIGTRNCDYIVIPFGYNLHSEKTKMNKGHQLLMVVNCSRLYELSHDIRTLTDHISDIILFIDNQFEGIVNYDRWVSYMNEHYTRVMDSWINPPKPQIQDQSKLPSWAPKRKPKSKASLDKELKEWTIRKKHASEDTYHLVMDCLTSHQDTFALASINIVGAIKKKKSSKKKATKKKKKLKKKKLKKKKRFSLRFKLH